MFLFERIIGIGVYMVVLLFVCLLLTKINLACKTVFKFYLFCLCLMAFFYKPYITGDLYRIYEQVDLFSTMSFGYFWDGFATGSSIPVARLLYWCIGRIGVKGLLPAFSAFICYSIIFYIIHKTKKLYSISKDTVALILFYIMTTSIYISTIGGIRMMLALCMISFSYFRGIVEKKVGIIDVIFYVMSIFIHAMSFVVIAVCVLVALFDSERGFVRKIGYAFVAIVGCVVLVVTLNNTLRGFYQKAISYLLGEMHSDPWEYAMGVLIIITLFLMYTEFYNICREEGICLLKNYNSASIFCVIIAICLSFEFSIFYRFGGHIAVIFAMPSMMFTLEKTKGKRSAFIKWINFRDLLILFSLVIAAISCARGSLSSLKFFEL